MRGLGGGQTYLVGQGLLKTIEGDADDEEKEEHDPAVGAVA
jgi:hypothetical protein